MRHKLYAIGALTYLMGVAVVSFHRMTWRQWLAAVRGIWAIKG